MFKEILLKSKSVTRYMELERLKEDGIIELYFDCYCSYMEMMRERIKCGRELNRVLSAYKHIPAFCQASPRQLFSTMFNSPVMHRWFAFRFIATIDKQIIYNNADQDELWVVLTYTRAIPTAKIMEDILNGNIRMGESSHGEETMAGGEARRTKQPDKQSV